MTTGTTGTTTDPDEAFEDLVRATMRAVARQTVVADHLEVGRVPVGHIEVDRSMPRRRQRLSIVAVAAGVLVALVVAAGVVRSSGRPDVVDTPGASAPSTTPAPTTTPTPSPPSAPIANSWPATPTAYCLGWLDLLNARPTLDFQDTAGRDRFMDAMAQLSGANVRTAWQDRSALVPDNNGKVGIAQPVADSAMFMCPTRVEGTDAPSDLDPGHVVLINPASAEARWPENAPDVPAPEIGTTIAPGSGYARWPTDAPPDYCTGWQHYLDVQAAAPGPTSVQTEGFKRYTTQLAAIAPGGLGADWIQLRDVWATPDKAAHDDSADGSAVIHQRIYDESMAACPGAKMP